MSDYSIKWNSHFLNLVTVLNSFMENEKLTDVTSVAENGKQIQVHSFVLFASSSYFRAIALLKSNLLLTRLPLWLFLLLISFNIFRSCIQNCCAYFLSSVCCSTKYFILQLESDC